VVKDDAEVMSAELRAGMDPTEVGVRLDREGRLGMEGIEDFRRIERSGRGSSVI
jgi:hypothetical protein